MKKSPIHWLSCLLIFISLFGCTSPQKPIAHAVAESSGSAGTIHIYRPISDWKAPAITFKVFVNDQFFADLTHGGEIKLNLDEGTHAVEVKGFFLGFQDGKTASHTINIHAGSKAYLRFAQNLDGFTLTGKTVVVKGSSNLLQVDAADWAAKR